MGHQPAPVAQATATMLVSMLERAPWVAPDELLELARVGARAVGARVHNLLLVDMEQRFLKPFPGSATGDPQGVDATLAGRAYRSMEPVHVHPDGSPGRLFLPLLDGSARLGVLELEVDDGPEEQPERYTALARIVAAFVVSKGPYGDVITQTRRRRDMELAAEIQWELLPPLTLATPTVSVSGILEPCYEIGGDTFDYAFNRPQVHFLLCDAMGHGLDSSMMSSLLVGAYRNCRRAGWTMPETYERMDALMVERFGEERFATAQIGSLDCRDGALRWINAGHPAPMLVRRGKVVGRLEAAPCLPVGFGEGLPELVEEQLEPGDTLLLFTDGVVEARSEDGGFFGEERLADLLERACGSGEPVPEILRRLTNAVLNHQAGNLRDDATMLLINWHEPLPGDT